MRCLSRMKNGLPLLSLVGMFTLSMFVGPLATPYQEILLTLMVILGTLAGVLMSLGEVKKTSEEDSSRWLCTEPSTDQTRKLYSGLRE